MSHSESEVPTGDSTIQILEDIRSAIGGLKTRGLKSNTRYGENEMRSRCWGIVNDMINSLQLKETQK